MSTLDLAFEEEENHYFKGISISGRKFFFFGVVPDTVNVIEAL